MVIDPKIPIKLSFRQSLSRNPILFKRLWIPAQQTAGMTDMIYSEALVIINIVL